MVYSKEIEKCAVSLSSEAISGKETHLGRPPPKKSIDRCSGVCTSGPSPCIARGLRLGRLGTYQAKSGNMMTLLPRLLADSGWPRLSCTSNPRQH
jgi:hypothetical protein